MSRNTSNPNESSDAANTTNSLIYREPTFAPYTICDILRSAALAFPSQEYVETRKELCKRLFDYENMSLPPVPEPSLIDMDFSIAIQVGWIHHTSDTHHDCELSCSKLYLRLTYCPLTTHESHETAAICIEYRVYEPSGQEKRASGFHLQHCDWRWGNISSSRLLEDLVKALDLSAGLKEFNYDLALWMAKDISRQVREEGEFNCLIDYSNVFRNVEDEVDRFLGIWEEIKDDIFHHLFTEHHTHFHSRNIGLFI